MRIKADTDKILKQLGKPDFLKLLDKRLSDIITFDEIENAFWFALNLEQTFKDHPDFENNRPEIYKKVQPMIKKARWVALSLLSEDEVIKMFKSNLMAMFEIQDYDIHKYFDSRLLIIFPLDIRDEFKDKVRKAIEENKELMTKEKIKINKEMKNPTTGNWISHMHSVLGIEDIPLFKLIEYFFQDSDIAKLEDNERRKIETILKFYEKIKMSSQTLEGMEISMPVDDEGRKGEIVGGYFQPLKYNEKEYKKINAIYKKILAIEKGGVIEAGGEKELEKESLKKEIKKYGIKTEGKSSIISEEQTKPIDQKIEEAYKRNTPLLKKIKEDEVNIISKIKESPQEINSMLIEMFKNKEAEKLSATLLVIARLGKTKEIMSDMSVKKIFMEEVIPLLKKQITNISEPELIDKFKQNTSDPIHVKILIKYILSKIFGEREEEAAFVATQLENIFSVLEQQEYLGLAFYNMKTDKFEWANVKMSDQGDLVME